MNEYEHRYFVLYKPRNMVSQFISPDDVPLLGELNYPFPEGAHAIGRLDKDSEGILLLTTDKRVTKLLFLSGTPHERTYLVKVLHVISNEKIEQLRNGILIPIQNGAYHLAKPVEVNLVTEPELYIAPETNNNPYLKYSWLTITLTEGKFHEIRKMVQALGHPCLRLVRIRIVNLHLDRMQPGEVKELSKDDFFRLLKLDDRGSIRKIFDEGPVQ